MWALFVLLLLLPYTAFSQPLDCDHLLRGHTFTQAELDQTLQQPAPINLCDTNLSGLDLSHANLSGANLSGADLSYAILDRADLSTAKLHKTFFRWSSLIEVDLSDADLSNADLQATNLTNSNLRRANLSHAALNNSQLPQAQLFYANLQQANLSNANLQHGNLSWANLNQAILVNTQLQHADLSHSSLIGADLTEANLSNSNLQQADLSHVLLIMTNLDQADFSQTNLDHAFYQPELGYLPNIVTLSTAHNLRSMQFDPEWGIPALVELRTAYNENGMRKMEREITAMVKTKEMQESWQRGGWGYLESSISYILFYLSSDYGAKPGRPLRIFLAAIFLFAIPYYFTLRYPSYHNKIVVIWQPKHILRSDSRHVYEKSNLIYSLHYRSQATFLGTLYEILRLGRLALYISLLMAFQIGWRELNVSSWLSRLQKHNYRFKPTGWVRIFAGTQSLISAYLILLWILTYFSRPFEW